MSELDAVKEQIAFLTKLFFVIIGIMVVTISGLISLLMGDVGEHIPLFWFGIIVIVICAVACLKIFTRINHYIEEIRKL